MTQILKIALNCKSLIAATAFEVEIKPSVGENHFDTEPNLTTLTCFLKKSPLCLQAS